MIVLSAKKLKKEYGTDIILQDVSFHINDGDRIGVVGVNGAGKSTLMNILAGELSHEGGDFFVSKDTETGYLKQRDSFESDATIEEAAFSICNEITAIGERLETLSCEIAALGGLGTLEDNGAKSHLSGSDTALQKLLKEYELLQHKFEVMDGYNYERKIDMVLQNMAFGEKERSKRISMLSGGERTRLSLALLLLKNPRLLLLDEPTNHLDIGMLKWVEEYLASYRGALMVVSHDRYFLDKTVNRIFEIENRKLHIYEGNYSAYIVQRKRRLDFEMREYTKQREEIARQEDIIRRFKERKTELLAKRARSREKMLEHMEIIDKPEAPRDSMKINFSRKLQSGYDVLYAEGLTKGFGHGEARRELFKNVNFDIKRGERICIVGANGVGKTTLLKIILGELLPDSGYIHRGHNVNFAYYDQQQESLVGANSVIEELKDEYRLYTDTEMRNILGRFLFRGDDVFKSIDSLSGGEKARVSLLKMMLKEANVLLLDEPTNHLDIASKEAFEDALLEYPGTVIAISHDRYFLNRIPDKVMELTAGGFITYLGNYDYYVEKKAAIASGQYYVSQLTKEQSIGREAEKSIYEVTPAGKTSAGDETRSAMERRLRKEKEAEERRQNRAREEVEKKIAELEAKVGELEAELEKDDIIADHEELAALCEVIAVHKEELEALYDEWIGLQG